MARPHGSTSSYKNRNKLSDKDMINLIEDYSNMTNKLLCKKYGISKTQLRNIRIKEGLKSKNLSSIIEGRKSLEEFKGLSGYYAIVRIDVCKAYIEYSDNIYHSLLGHIITLQEGNHDSNLQSDWNKYEFFYTTVSEKPELDSFVLYKQYEIDQDGLVFKEFKNDAPLKRSKLYEYVDLIKSLREKGTSYKKIADSLPISTSTATVFNFCKRL